MLSSFGAGAPRVGSLVKVIVQANDMGTVAALVRGVGGTVTHELVQDQESFSGIER